VDFWHLDSLKEIGNTKAYCSVGVEWAPDGRYLMTSVLHDRVKVDNEIKIFSATGKLLCSKSFKESELHDVQW